MSLAGARWRGGGARRAAGTTLAHLRRGFRLPTRSITVPITLTLLTILAAVGVIDVGYYHIYKLRLFAEPKARFEQLAHLCRGALFVAMLCLVLPVTPRGRWVDAGIALF